MNLIGDPWIPVVDDDGKSVTVGLRELYERAHEIRDLALQPPQRIAVTRLLLCITHAALDGPEDEDDWRSCKDRIVPESLAYLAERLDRFELYGERPFLQVGGLVPTDNASLDKLDLGLASGNMPTLFDHAASPDGRPNLPGSVALNLLTYQCFSPGGLVGETAWGGVRTGRSSNHAPCIEESPLHAFLRGMCVLDTMHLNLATRGDVASPWGLPVWDIGLPEPQSAEAEDLATSFLGRLVPLSRAVLLRDGACTCTCANGLAYPKVPAGREPHATVVTKTRQGRPVPGYLRIALDRHPWREAASVLAVRAVGVGGGPLPLRHLARSRDLGTVDVWLGGLAADRARLLDAAEWVFSVPAALLGDAEMTAYGAGVALAAKGEEQLGSAINTWGKALKKQGNELAGVRSLGTRPYWTALDAQYEILVEIACSDEPDLDGWHGVVLRAMRDAYQVACPHTSPRQIQAFAQGNRSLYLPKEYSQEGQAP